MIRSKRFHIADGRLVKTSNGQPVPEDEPVFIIRGRDELAVGVILDYLNRARQAGCDEGFLSELSDLCVEFSVYARDRQRKLPNVTRGR